MDVKVWMVFVQIVIFVCFLSLYVSCCILQFIDK